MKIGLAIVSYFPFGGAQRDCLTVARLLTARGHDVLLFASRWHDEIDQPVDIPLVLLPVGRRTNHGRNAAFGKALLDAARLHDVDLLVGFDKLPGLDVYVAADDCFKSRKNGLSKLTPRYHGMVAMERAVFDPTRSTAIVALVQHQIDDYQKTYRTPIDRFTLLPPLADASRFQSACRPPDRMAMRNELGFPASATLLLAVASRPYVKGVDRSIRALAALDRQTLRDRDIRLLVVGAKQPQRLKRLAARFGLTDRIVFQTARDDIPQVMAASDLLIHPARLEAAGLVLIEALGCGLPVLTMSVCGYASHVAVANAGIVLPKPFQQSALNSALDQMLDSDRLADYREKALAYVARTNLTDGHSQMVLAIEKAGSVDQRGG